MLMISLYHKWIIGLEKTRSGAKAKCIYMQGFLDNHRPLEQLVFYQYIYKENILKINRGTREAPNILLAPLIPTPAWHQPYVNWWAFSWGLPFDSSSLLLSRDNRFVWVPDEGDSLDMCLDRCLYLLWEQAVC